MEDITSHPMGPLPWALSTPDGLLRKTNKASLATALQKNVTVADQLPPNPACVIDGMNLVQRVKGDQVTFGDIATIVLTMAMCEGEKVPESMLCLIHMGRILSRTVATAAGYHKCTDCEAMEKLHDTNN